MLVVKKLFALLLVAGFLFSMAGCPTPTSPPKSGGPSTPAGGGAGAGGTSTTPAK
jgi:hypothetical protein